MDKNLCFSLITWLKTFPSYENIVPSDLTNGVPLAHILHLIAPEHFSDHWVSRIRTDVSDNWRLKVSNLKKVYQGVIDFFYHTELPVQALQEFPFPDVNKIAENEDEVELGRLLQLILGCAINCAQKQKHIENIMKLEESIQTLIVNAIQDLMSSDGSLVNPEISGGASPSGVWLGPASFQPQVKTMMEQLETLSLAKDDLTKRCNELDLQVSVLTEEKKALKDEKEVLVEKIELLEAGEDIGGQSFRNKDLRKQVESLQDELFKIESSRDDYRSRMESFEKENKELTSRIDELQNLADESRTLKDEVDALRDMSERVAVFEGTVETYKKKLEELNDLKRQLKLLEEKNSEYMHQNMELEEEIKKSGTWRPQLELYKKQVAELHQKLSDEAKRTDRQIFENKKLNEKLEALAQEKERVMVERDVLKENVDELKCTITAFNSTETSSRAPTDLSDLDNLEIVSPEIREKLVRLQHENRLLKQKASDRSVESSSVLQSLLSDLQERHDKIVQENRWGKSSHPLSNLYSPWPFFDRILPISAFLLPETSQLNNNGKSFKRVNRGLVRWASDSDLVLAQRRFYDSQICFPVKTSSSNAISFHANNNLTSCKSLSSPAARRPTTDTPIIIRHIHEFKVTSSPTNEDSGCCRTSPSSCEGYEDHRVGGLCGSDTPEYGGTLDSGISGVYRCLSPDIPSILEEGTGNRVTDISQAICREETFDSNYRQSLPSCSNAAAFLPGSRQDFKIYSFGFGDLGHVTPADNHSQTCYDYNALIDVKKKGPNSRRRMMFTDRGLSSDSDLNSSILHNSSLPSSAVLSLPHRPEPPGSPTPHNSPKLPHSLQSSRNKINKVGVSPQVIRRGSKPQITKDFSKTLEDGNSELVMVADKQKTAAMLSQEGFLETDLDSPYESRIRTVISNEYSTGLSKRDLEIQRSDNGKNIYDDSKVNLGTYSTREEIKTSEHSERELMRDTEINALHPVNSAAKRIEDNYSSLFHPHYDLLHSFPHVSEEYISKSFTGKEGVPNVNTVNHPTANFGGNPNLDSSKYSSKITESLLAENHLSPKSHSDPLFRCVESEKRNRMISLPSASTTYDQRTNCKEELFTRKNDACQSEFASKNDSSLISSLNCFPFSIRSKSKESPHSRKESQISDRETDLEFMENHLIAGAYAAPIASSDSSTSFYHSDTTTDIDPSATDYYTEPEIDFNPNQYKVMTISPNCLPCGRQTVDPVDLEVLLGSPSRPVVRSPTYFQRKKTQLMSNSKKKLKDGAVIKIKNKTAKALAAETFNAMFLLCTP